MGVFISWSGDKSHLAAQLLRDWISKVIQRTQCFLSSKDTGAGSLWLDSVLSQLKGSDVGIVCLSKENIQNTWIHFEAGAIVKEVDKARLCPLLIDITPPNVTGPLTAFQMKQWARTGIFDIIQMINSTDENPLSQSDLTDSFEVRWPLIEAKIAEVKAIPEATGPSTERSQREILTLVRSFGAPIARFFGPPIAIYGPDNPLRLTSLHGSEITSTNLVGTADEKAQTMGEALIEEVRKRRPLILSWLESADCSRIGVGVLIFRFSIDQSIALESLSRPNNKKILDEVGKELGFQILLPKAE
jgi:TIR domain